MAAGSFSERYGHNRIKEIQLDDMDSDLKNRIWNRFYDLLPLHGIGYGFDQPSVLMKSVWRNFFKADADAFSVGQFSDHKRWIKDRFFRLEWFKAYDFLEFVARGLQGVARTEFIDDCNTILEEENSGYRFIGGRITDITNEKEISEVKGALDSADTVKAHIDSALRLYSNRPQPDYRNSVKESVSAVEAICNRITGSNLSLGDALKILDKNPKITIPTPLKLGFEKIYAYTSSSHGIRHALVDNQVVNQEEARFMLIACSAFVNYLKVKAQKARVLI